MKKLTIAIPNRERDLRVVKRTLQSISQQGESKQMKVEIVDYGSSLGYQEELKSLVRSFSGFSLQCYPVQGQLWNKSRAINSVLKNCTTPYFMVADMDMIFHPQFIKNTLPTLKINRSFYYPVGIMTQAESAKSIPFEEYKIKFSTTEEATGISIFPTDVLLSINGFDEFYHGWGSEDTDVHVRLAHKGHSVLWQEDTLFFLHQWHPKSYRTKKSVTPYHSGLERLNARYLDNVKYCKKIEANMNRKWGEMQQEQTYSKLLETPLTRELVSTEENVGALCASLVENYRGRVSFKITEVSNSFNLRRLAKVILMKEKIKILPLDKANNQILSTIITHFSDLPYFYSYNQITREIVFKIALDN